jgi:aspartate dehydrogenase
MSKILKIGIVGCGAIGSYLAETILNRFNEEAELSAIFDIQTEKLSILSDRLANKKLIALNLEDLILKSQLVIEATHTSSAYEIAQRAISFQRHIMVMSVGGILKRFFELKELAKEKKVKLLIPSGAICGIDGLKAMALSKIEKVLLTTRKNPKAFKGNIYLLRKKINLDKIREDTLLFSGNASEAIRFFPQNINICATLAIVVGDPKKIEVRIIASPHIDKNIHELEIESNAGKIFTRCENVVCPQNPKTSFLAVLSAIACLKDFIESFKIGT